MRLPERSSRGLRAVRLANEGMEQTKPAIAQNEAGFAAHPRCSADCLWRQRFDARILWRSC